MSDDAVAIMFVGLAITLGLLARVLRSANAAATIVLRFTFGGAALAALYIAATVGGWL